MLSELMAWLGVWLKVAVAPDGHGDPFPPVPK